MVSPIRSRVRLIPSSRWSRMPTGQIIRPTRSSAALGADPDIDGFMGTGSGLYRHVGPRCRPGRWSRGVCWCRGFDITPELLDAIEAGADHFTIDQQQYLQGHLLICALYLKTLPTSTSPGRRPADPHRSGLRRRRKSTCDVQVLSRRQLPAASSTLLITYVCWGPAVRPAPRRTSSWYPSHSAFQLLGIVTMVATRITALGIHTGADRSASGSTDGRVAYRGVFQRLSSAGYCTLSWRLVRHLGVLLRRSLFRLERPKCLNIIDYASTLGIMAVAVFDTAR